MTGREYAAQHGETDWTTADYETALNLADIDHLPDPQPEPNQPTAA